MVDTKTDFKEAREFVQSNGLDMFTGAIADIYTCEVVTISLFSGARIPPASTTILAMKRSWMCQNERAGKGLVQTLPMKGT